MAQTLRPVLSRLLCPSPLQVTKCTPAGHRTHGDRGAGVWGSLLLVCLFVFVRILVLSGSFHPGEEGRRACSQDGLRAHHLPPAQPPGGRHARSPEQRGGAGHAGSCSPPRSGGLGSGEEGAWGGRGSKRARIESAGILRRTFANASKLPGSRREGLLPGKFVQRRFSSYQHFLWITPPKL